MMIPGKLHCWQTLETTLGWSHHFWISPSMDAPISQDRLTEYELFVVLKYNTDPTMPVWRVKVLTKDGIVGWVRVHKDLYTITLVSS